MNHIWKNEPIISISLDTDWASEVALQYTYDIIEKHSIKATFFLTNPSEVLQGLIRKGYIDGGIHPNFLPESSQGKNIREVIDYCMSLLPNIKSFRSHRYFDVNDITELLVERGLKYDSNLCTYLEKIEPFKHRSGLIRFPVYFEDGAYLLNNGNLSFKDIKEKLFYQPGLMVLNFHPMHIALNSPNFNFMKKIKLKLSRERWNNLNYNDLMELSYKGYGMKDFFISLLDFINIQNIKTYTLDDLYNMVVP